MKYTKEEENFTVYLSFESQETLDLWTLTDGHDELVAKIETHFIKPEAVDRI